MIEFVLSRSTWAGCAVMMGFTAVAGLWFTLLFTNSFQSTSAET
jgi:hypothetical protein